MFYTDKPILSDKEDLLKRDNFAKLLANTLLNIKSRDTFTVGLFGEWGSGKTSLVNMMLSELQVLQEGCDKKEKLIVVHFEPWNFSNGDQLLTQFFIRLSNEFRSKKDKQLANIGDALERYSDAFDAAETIPVVGGLVALLGKKGSSALGKRMKKGFGDRDILKQKEYVMELLEKQTNKILIVIDDIDRLSNQQIRQVFQLITSVAKFPNTTYLLAFDKKIVVKALEQVQEGKGEDYLEKIIQMPIQIPNIQKRDLHQILFNRLDGIIAEYNGVLFSSERWQRIFPICVSPYVKNLRDVNRLCNSIQFKLAALSEEVNFVDMVALAVLEIYMPEVFEWVKGNKAYLTGAVDMEKLDFSNKSQKDWLEIFQNEFRILLHDNGEVSVERTIEFLVLLFPHFGHKVGKTYEYYDMNTLRKNNHIGHPDKFDRYFHLNIDDIVLKKSEILHAVYSLDQTELKTFILELEQNDKTSEFLDEIEAITADIPENRVRCIVETLVEVAFLLKTNISQYWFSISAGKKAEFVIVDLIEKIPENGRKKLICDIIESSNLNSLSTCADVINKIELGYGRLAAKGDKRDYKKIITLDELLEVEKVFSNRVQELIKNDSIFSSEDWRMVYYLMEYFEPEYMGEYMAKELKDDQNVLIYFASSVGIWTGSGTRYEIRRDYEKYLKEKDILNAIHSQRKNGKFFLLSPQVQDCCAAFYLYKNEKWDYEGRVTQEDVDELIASWKET